MEITKRTPTVWDPFDVILDLQSDLNRVLNRSLTRRGDWDKSPIPIIEVHEEQDQYLVHADLPGLKKEDLKISVEGNLLTIQGERKQEKETKSKGYQYTERFYGIIARTIELPAEIQQDKVKASYKDGVLEVTLPKSESAKPKLIQVDVK